MNLKRILLVALLALSAPAALAQPAPSTPGEAAAPAAGLPSGVPRSMRAYTHVFIAYSVAWLLLFGYTVTIGRKLGRLEDELRSLPRD